jgi:hypothetical protein
VEEAEGETETETEAEADLKRIWRRVRRCTVRVSVASKAWSSRRLPMLSMLSFTFYYFALHRSPVTFHLVNSTLYLSFLVFCLALAHSTMHLVIPLPLPMRRFHRYSRVPITSLGSPYHLISVVHSMTAHVNLLPA